MTLLIPVSSRAADARTMAEAYWSEGIAAYEAKDYAKAVECFEQIVALEQTSADLYYNLGNAWFKLGQHDETMRPFAGGELGRAVLNYRRALHLNPAMDDARYNLDIAVEYTNDTEPLPESFIVRLWHTLRDGASPNSWAVASIVAFVLMLAFVLLYLLISSIVVRKLAFSFAVVLFASFILCMTFALSSCRAMEQHDMAVIVCNDTAPVHASPDSASKILREPSQGVTVELLRTHDTWVEVRMMDGEKGWIRRSAVEHI